MKARTLITLLVAAIVTVSGAWGQSTKNLSQFSELPEAPNAADWFYMWDTSAGVSKKISPANLFSAMPNPGLTTLGGVKRNVGTAGQFVTGIDSDGSLLYDTPAGGPGGGITLVGSRIPYGDGAGSYTHEATFYYDASNDKLVVGALGLGTTAQIGLTGGNGFNFYNATDNEAITMNVGIGGANTVTWDSSTGINLMDMGSINVKVPVEAYNATTWNGSPNVPTKGAVRDAIEALVLGGTSLTSTYVAYGSGSNTPTGEAAFTYNASTNTLTVENFSTTNLTATNFNAGSLKLVETSGVGTQTVQLLMGSDYVANRAITIFGPDNDIDMTLPSAGTFTLAATNVAQTWGDGIKQTFNPNGTNAGINVGPQAGDPSTLTDGDIWYNSTSNEFKARINGASVALGASSGGSLTLASFRSNPIVWDEFTVNGTIGTSKFGPFGFAGSTSGTGAALTGDPAAIALNATNGQIVLESGTVASSSYAALNSDTTAFQFNQTTPTAAFELEFRVLIKALSPTQAAGSDDYTVRVGFIDISNAGAPVDGCYFEFTSADTEWQIKTVSNTSNVSSADSGVTVAEDTWYKLNITVNPAADSIGFYINGTQVTNSPLTTTANIPRTTTRYTGIGALCAKGSGATEAQILLDYCGLATTYGASR